MSDAIILVENDTLHWKETRDFNDMCIRYLDKLYTPELPLENQARGYIVLRTLVIERRPVEYLEGYRSVFNPILFNFLADPIAWSVIRYSHVQESL
jgi:hypothetical protein